MKLTSDQLNQIVHSQTRIWILAILFASGYALFAKLVWTAKFPILIFLPLFMIGFALASVNGLRSTLRPFVDADA